MHISVARRLTFAGLAAIGVASCTDNSAPEAPTAPDLHRTHGPSAFTLTEQQSGTTNRLQAISAVNDRIVWASGVGGSYTVTTDGGRTWRAGVVPGADSLQFRDVEAISAREAYLMAAGTGSDSRIYKTVDGGRHWRLQFENTDPNAFYDCFAFWSRDRGITTSDAVNGRFPVIQTRDGEHWRDIGDNLPAAQAGEASFAASGTCVAVAGERHAWIGTGGAAQARILATTDAGRTWNAYGTPIVQGTPSSGVITLAFRDQRHGILAGGDLAITDAFTDNVATSDDGGQTWDLASHPTFTGSVYGLAYTSHFGRAVVATGPAGASWSPDEGQSWFALDSTVHDFWAVTFASPDAGWLVGVGGRIVKVSFPDRRWGWH